MMRILIEHQKNGCKSFFGDYILSNFEGGGADPLSLFVVILTRSQVTSVK